MEPYTDGNGSPSRKKCLTWWTTHRKECGTFETIVTIVKTRNRTFCYFETVDTY